MNGEKKNISHRTRCLKYQPFGTGQCSPNAVKPRHRVVNNLVVSNYRQKMKLRAMDYLGNACWECGYSRCKAAMVFHHIDPVTKLFGIADGRTRRWEILVAELDKCALLCNRCHEEVHAGMVDLDYRAKFGGGLRNSFQCLSVHLRRTQERPPQRSCASRPVRLSRIIAESLLPLD